MKLDLNHVDALYVRSAANDPLGYCQGAVANSCFLRFDDAGPELEPQPAWAHGALFFVPITKQEIQEAQFTLRPHHIVAAEADVPLIQEALAEIPKRQKRPKPAVERQWSITATKGSKSDVQDVDEDLWYGEDAEVVDHLPNKHNKLYKSLYLHRIIIIITNILITINIISIYIYIYIHMYIYIY